MLPLQIRARLSDGEEIYELRARELILGDGDASEDSSIDPQEPSTQDMP
jgi:hypothetical protein